MNAKRIILGSITGSIALTTLGISFSFAWYNTSENLYIDSLVINVSGARDVKISNINDKETLTEYLQYHYDEVSQLDGGGFFKPVSSMYKDDWMNDKRSDPEYYEYLTQPRLAPPYYVPAYERATWGYYAEHLYLWANTDTRVTLDSLEEALSITPIVKRNEAYATKLINDPGTREMYPGMSDEEIKAKIVNELNELPKCIRIAILDPDVETYRYWIFDLNKEGETIMGGRQDLFLSTYYDSYINSENKEKYEVIYGEVTGREFAVYDDMQDEDSPAPSEYTSFNSRTQANVHAFNYEQSMANEEFDIAKEDSISREEIENKFYFDLKGDEMKEFVLAIYMEGWDTDCNNYHMGGSFQVDMKFKVSESSGQ